MAIGRRPPVFFRRAKRVPPKRIGRSSGGQFPCRRMLIRPVMADSSSGPESFALSFLVYAVVLSHLGRPTSPVESVVFGQRPSPQLSERPQPKKKEWASGVDRKEATDVLIVIPRKLYCQSVLGHPPSTEFEWLPWCYPLRSWTTQPKTTCVR